MVSFTGLKVLLVGGKLGLASTPTTARILAAGDCLFHRGNHLLAFYNVTIPSNYDESVKLKSCVHEENKMKSAQPLRKPKANHLGN